MRITSLANATRDFLEAWDAYVRRHPAAWFWHTSGWLAYQLHFRQGNEDASFAVVSDDGVIVAAVPLVLTQRRDRVEGLVREFSFSGDPCPYGVSSSRDAASLAEREIRRRARACGVRRAQFWGNPFSDARDALEDLLAQAETTAAAQRVAELGAGPAARWGGVRASYRSLIHRAQERYAIRARWADGDDTEAFALYQRLHRRETNAPRPDATYRLQGQWHSEGLALIVTAADPAGDWGASYWNVYKGCAYYSSGAYSARDVAHAMVWLALAELEASGVRLASLGWQGTAQSDKERAIEFFKRGFGGRDVPVSATSLWFRGGAE